VDDTVAFGKVVHVFGHEDPATHEEHLFILEDWFEHVQGHVYKPTVADRNRERWKQVFTVGAVVGTAHLDHKCTSNCRLESTSISHASSTDYILNPSLNKSL
jgi:hypothetical protein